MKLRLFIPGLILLLVIAAIGLEAMWPMEGGAMGSQPVQPEETTKPDSTTRNTSQHQNIYPADLMSAFLSAEHDSMGLSFADLAGEPRLLRVYPLEAIPPTPQDYNDPTAGGAVPLIHIEGLEEELLSPHFSIGDIAAHDGASYARISLRLVNTLEVIRQLAEAPIFVNSGYRHPALNADSSVGGAARSQHLAGRAADIWSSEKTPGELAELALAVTGCTAGIGLGRTYIHIDVRGYLASWVYKDAEMDEATFDDWVHTRCHTDLSMTPLPFAEATRLSALRSEMEAAVLKDTLIANYRAEMAAFASAQYQEQGKGAVLLDLRLDESAHEAAFSDQLSYVFFGSEEAKQWNLDPLILSAEMDTYFVFGIIAPDSNAAIGVMRYGYAPSGKP